MREKIVKLSPFLVTGLIIIYTWINSLIEYGEMLISVYHWIGITLFIVNIIFYIKKFDVGLLLTGIYLFLVMFNLLEVFESTDTFSFSLGSGDNKVKLPGIELKALLIFLFYLKINFSVIKVFWEKSYKK
jgi:hypothetical protein